MNAKSLLLRLLLVITVLVLSGGNGYSLFPFFRAGAQTLPKPNIVLIVTDDQHIHHLQNMPYLSNNPKGHWVTFTNAFENVPLCCPSRANILSGQYAHHTGVNTNGGSRFRDSSTVATWLKSAGYQTALVGKYLNGYPFSGKPPIPPGWDYWVAFHGGQDYYNYDLNENGIVNSYGSTAQDYSTDVFYNRAISFLDTTSPDQPFFLYFATQAPHQNFTPAPRHAGTYRTLPIFYGPNFNEADVSDKPAWVRSLPLLNSNTDNGQRKASETLLAVDEAIKGIMDNIEAKGQLDNTVIIFITDNGFSFGAHRWQEKRCVYEECIKTPLLIRYPWTDARTEPRLVQNVDLAPTIAELAQVSPAHQVDGRSLVPLLNNTVTEWRSSVLLEMQDGSAVTRPFWSVRTLEWKYVELNTTGEKELYDLVNDPYELQNLADLQAYANIQSSLAAELAALRSSTTTTPTPTAIGPTRTPTFTPTATLTPTPTFTATPVPSGASITSTFTPSEDAYVRSADPTVNYGTGSTLRAYKSGSSSQTNSHLRFSVAGITGPVQSAKLRLYVTDASSIGGGVIYRSVDNNWTETGINYSNQPSTGGSALATLRPVSAGTWIEMDVSSVVTANGVYTFGLLGNSSDVAYFGSRETLNKPQLVVTYTNLQSSPTIAPTFTSSSFSDVPDSYWAWDYIERLYASGVTSGCGSSPLMYCPTTTVTRDQMAVFLLRAEHGSSYVPPAPTGVFEDVPTNYWAASWIEQLSAEGITGGCSVSPRLYCPTTPVTRDQMAVFLLRAEHSSSYVPPAATGVFEDVPTDYWAASWIEQLAAEGITGGCSAIPKLYCPTTPVTRDQMAVFLVKTFNLP